MPGEFLRMSLFVMASAALSLPASAEAAPPDAREAVRNALTQARGCLTQLRQSRSSAGVRKESLDAFARQLANRIDYAESWLERDPAVAARIIGSTAGCHDQLMAWAQQLIEKHADSKARVADSHRALARQWQVDDSAGTAYAAVAPRQVASR